MKLRFVLNMVAREARGTRRRLVLYVGAIALGVTALVAINSFRADVARSIREQSRTLLGADLEIRSRGRLPDSVTALIDSMVAAGDRVSRVISLGSMVYVDRTGGSRLGQVRAVRGEFPFYGEIETRPANAWSRLQSGAYAVADPTLLVYLDARVGDTVQIGEARLEIIGTLTRVPGDIALQAAIGPRVYVPAEVIEGTSLLSRGSRAQHAAYIALQDPDALQPFLNHYNARFEDWDVRYDTVAEREEDFTTILDRLARFLGLVGLMALLLGGTGIASAVHVYVREKIPTVATLRCIGATTKEASAIYLIQATLMGLGGSVVGAFLGVAVQRWLPSVLANFLPVAVTAHFHGEFLATGIGIGLWTALVFASLPLLTIRRISPLRALRADHEPTGRDPARWLVIGALLVTVVWLGIWQAPTRLEGMLFAGGIAVTGAALWTVAKLMTWATRRFFPHSAAYVVRQGVANLFRPHNQTVAVTVAIGFGLFLLGTIDLVRRNLVAQFEIEGGGDTPNLVAFDVQRDQQQGVVDVFEGHGVQPREITPLISARVSSINGVTVDALLDDSTVTRNRWPLTREYRHTYRDTMVETETLIAGSWWDESAPTSSDAPARVSIEEDIAKELLVSIGDRITWNVQGIEIESEIANVRVVDWARFSMNFFLVFEPGALDDAPQSVVVLARVDNDTLRGIVQRDVVRAFPNVSMLDISVIMQSLDAILGSATAAVRFVAMFSLICGIIVLLGAVAASRHQRLRESVLLRTLGAQRPQIQRIIIVEYIALGMLASLTGGGLAAAASWGLSRFFFEVPFQLAALPLSALAFGATGITVLVGVLGSRSALTRPPLAVLRELPD